MDNETPRLTFFVLVASVADRSCWVACTGRKYGHHGVKYPPM